MPVAQLALLHAWGRHMQEMGWAIPSVLTIAAVFWASFRQNEHPLGYGRIAVLGRSVTAVGVLLLIWAAYFFLAAAS
jgi:hypothetical protein